VFAAQKHIPQENLFHVNVQKNQLPFVPKKRRKKEEKE
jgi:hypothetical protein